MTAYLVRHAAAGSRQEWRQPDDIRPLSKKGRRQAVAIAGRLAGEHVDRILSSPTVRCRQTVEPLADRLGLKVEPADELLDTADLDDAMSLLDGLANQDAVLSSHGELIPRIVERLEAGGMRVRGKRGWNKGSIWVLQRTGDRWATARWVPPA